MDDTVGAGSGDPGILLRGERGSDVHPMTRMRGTSMMVSMLCPASRLVAAIALTLLGAAVVRAHHSFDAEYDSNKPVTLTGFVTKLDWINPHAYVYIDTKDEGGAVKNYKIEM